MKRLNKLMVFAGLLLFIFTLNNCDTPMGFGDPIDLEPPILKITGIELNGVVREIDDSGSKILIGPSIMFGPGAAILGTAYDNYGVVELRILEKTTGKRWVSKDISERDADGNQTWRIELPGLDKGERVIEITAYDHASTVAQMNMGPETVKELSLLVDTEDPFIESIIIERHPGIRADLLPRSSFNTITHDNFDFIDYFQNEEFIIKAEVYHEFKLTDVSLNLLTETGQLVFPAPLQKDAGSSLQAPSWKITEQMLTNINPAYSSGKHIFKAVVTATADAGHSGSNNITNELYNLCWYPESDYPFFKANTDADGKIAVIASSGFPVFVFDDDNVGAVYWDIVSEDNWNGYMTGSSDEAKLANIVSNRPAFTVGGANLITNKNLSGVTRNAAVEISAPATNALWRLILIAEDAPPGKTVVTSSKVYVLETTDAVNPPCDLNAVVILNPAGPYSTGSVLNFRMLFGGHIYTEGASPASITIIGGAGGNQGGPITIQMTPVAYTDTPGSRTTSLSGSWTVTSGIVFYPIQIQSININGVKRYDEGEAPRVDSSVINTYNNHSAVNVMSIAPTITQIGNRTIAQNNADATKYILSPTANRSNLTLTFSHPVTPANGTITIRPAANWNIPPVLTDEAFTSVYNASSSTNKPLLTSTARESHYIKTTHGLEKNASDQYTGYPDTSTKYVLNFSSGISTGAGVSQLRTLLDSAKYNWQEIPVHTDDISVSMDGRTITVHLDKLPDGRLWKIEIKGFSAVPGAFLDEAGNLFAGWNEATTHTFWSQKTAEPVIRVERLTNNLSTTAPVAITAANVNTITATASRTNVRYRIDCETPGAVINYATSPGTTQNGRLSEITAGMTDTSIYRARQQDGPQNSNITPATAAYLLAMTPTTAYTAGSYLFIGDASLYTARMDYIAARASRTNPTLDQSDRGYEGAFKTIIVYRDVAAQIGAGRFLKIEAINSFVEGNIIAGFPMSYNMMDGSGSKFFFRNGGTNDADWIFISWEIVSSFYQVSPLTEQQNAPGALFNHANNNNSWSSFSEDWHIHSFRKFGNWGLRVRNL
jgi:hypothetical protein